MPVAAEIKVEPAEVNILDNETVELKATVTPASAMNGKKISWFSTKPGVVTVSPTWLVTGISAGEAVIEVSVDGVRTLVPVHVKPSLIPAETFSLDKTEATLSIGEELTLVPTITPENATNKTIAWKSSDEGVATVSPEGVIKAISFGTATITATLTKDLMVEVVITVPVPHPAAIFAKTNFDGKAFLKDNSNAAQVAMPFPDALDHIYTVDGKEYRLPTRNEWSILVPVNKYAQDVYGYTSKYDGQIVFGEPGYKRTEVIQEVVLNGKSTKYFEEHKGGATLTEEAFGKQFDTHRLAYAIRFMKPNRKGDEYATDNSLRAAYRYDFGVNYDGVALNADGKPKEENGYKQFALHITIRPLGEEWNGSLNDVADEDFWKKDADKDIHVTLPAVGNGGPKDFNMSGSYFAPKEGENLSSSYTAAIMFDTRASFTVNASRKDTYPLRLIRVLK